MAKYSIDLKSGSVADDKATDTRGEIIVGIDLGTTNSLVAHVRDGRAEAIAGPDGRSVLVPSLIHFAEDGSVLVGEAARPFLTTAPERTIYSVKRLLGKSYGDVAENQFGYKVLDEDAERLVKVAVPTVKDEGEGPESSSGLVGRRRAGARFYSPIELSALILRELKSRIEAELGQEVSRAVITVPAYFNDAQRQATRDAGKLAGLDVLRIVNEPTASSLAYGIGLTDEDEGRTIAVYDLGGGTFDVSILRIDQGIFEVLSTNGDTYLGGDDFDRAIIDHWTETYGLEVNDGAGRGTLRLLAESAKKALSRSEEFTADFGGTTVSLSRTDADRLFTPLVDKTIASCVRALSDAELEPRATSTR